tara:strand:+ start:1987 stop:2205 length:219 start_codon:yes stop_codon:yes gene_type:complete
MRYLRRIKDMTSSDPAVDSSLAVTGESLLRINPMISLCDVGAGAASPPRIKPMMSEGFELDPEAATVSEAAD